MYTSMTTSSSPYRATSDSSIGSTTATDLSMTPSSSEEAPLKTANTSHISTKSITSKTATLSFSTLESTVETEANSSTRTIEILSFSLIPYFLSTTLIKGPASTRIMRMTSILTSSTSVQTEIRTPEIKSSSISAIKATFAAASKASTSTLSATSLSPNFKLKFSRLVSVISTLFVISVEATSMTSDSSMMKGETKFQSVATTVSTTEALSSSQTTSMIRSTSEMASTSTTSDFSSLSTTLLLTSTLSTTADRTTSSMVTTIEQMTSRLATSITTTTRTINSRIKTEFFSSTSHLQFLSVLTESSTRISSNFTTKLTSESSTTSMTTFKMTRLKTLGMTSRSSEKSAVRTMSLTTSSSKSTSLPQLKTTVSTENTKGLTLLSQRSPPSTSFSGLKLQTSKISVLTTGLKNPSSDSRTLVSTKSPAITANSKLAKLVSSSTFRMVSSTSITSFSISIRINLKKSEAITEMPSYKATLSMKFESFTSRKLFMTSSVLLSSTSKASLLTSITSQMNVKSSSFMLSTLYSKLQSSTVKLAKTSESLATHIYDYGVSTSALMDTVHFSSLTSYEEYKSSKNAVTSTFTSTKISKLMLGTFKISKIFETTRFSSSHRQTTSSLMFTKIASSTKYFNYTTISSAILESNESTSTTMLFPTVVTARLASSLPNFFTSIADTSLKVQVKTTTAKENYPSISSISSNEAVRRSETTRSISSMPFTTLTSSATLVTSESVRTTILKTISFRSPNQSLEMKITSTNKTSSALITRKRFSTSKSIPVVNASIPPFLARSTAFIFNSPKARTFSNQAQTARTFLSSSITNILKTKESSNEVILKSSSVDRREPEYKSLHVFDFIKISPYKSLKTNGQSLMLWKGTSESSVMSRTVNSMHSVLLERSKSIAKTTILKIKYTKQRISREIFTPSKIKITSKLKRISSVTSKSTKLSSIIKEKTKGKLSNETVSKTQTQTEVKIRRITKKLTSPIQNALAKVVSSNEKQFDEKDLEVSIKQVSRTFHVNNITTFIENILSPLSTLIVHNSTILMTPTLSNLHSKMNTTENEQKIQTTSKTMAVQKEVKTQKSKRFTSRKPTVFSTRPTFNYVQLSSPSLPMVAKSQTTTTVSPNKSESLAFTVRLSKSAHITTSTHTRSLKPKSIAIRASKDGSVNTSKSNDTSVNSTLSSINLETTSKLISESEQNVEEISEVVSDEDTTPLTSMKPLVTAQKVASTKRQWSVDVKSQVETSILSFETTEQLRVTSHESRSANTLQSQSAKLSTNKEDKNLESMRITVIFNDFTPSDFHSTVFSRIPKSFSNTSQSQTLKDSSTKFGFIMISSTQLRHNINPTVFSELKILDKAHIGMNKTSFSVMTPSRHILSTAVNPRDNAKVVSITFKKLNDRIKLLEANKISRVFSTTFVKTTSRNIPSNTKYHCGCEEIHVDNSYVYFDECIAEYTCFDGYYMLGSSLLYCYGDTWSLAPPECLGKSRYSEPLYCGYPRNWIRGCLLQRDVNCREVQMT